MKNGKICILIADDEKEIRDIFAAAADGGKAMQFVQRKMERKH